MSVDTLIERGSELGLVRELLANESTTLVVVRGERGTGKTTFLATVAEQASATGWTVAGRDHEGPLSVSPRVTAARFGERVARLLGVEAVPKRAVSPRSALLNADGAGLPYGAAELGRGLLELLHQHAPVLLQVDRFSPSPALARWFDDLVDAIRRRRLRVVLMIAAEPSGRMPSGPVDRTIELAPLDRAAIARHLSGVATNLEPSLTTQELEAYAAAGVRVPERVGALSRLLAAAAGEPP